MTDILIVDDSLTVRMDLVEAVEAAGFVAVPCATLAAARSAVKTRPIKLAVLDVRLPDGDGVDFLHELRANPHYTTLPIVMLSTEAEVKDRIRGITTGANDYVGKPYDTDSLISRIRQLLSNDPGKAEGPLVLVIDDSVTFRDVVVSTLAKAGYRTAGAPSGSAGLRLAGSDRPDAIIVDGFMPEMDGATVIRRVRLDPALRSTPVLLLTGSDEAVDEITALDAGADAYVRKGPDLEVLLARVAAMLRATTTRVSNVPSLVEPKRVLAVDDDDNYLEVLRDCFSNDAIDIVVARSGEQAFELLAVQQVDCILVDLQMPGMSGHEVCRRIKAAPTIRDIPLIIVTGHEGREVQIAGLEAGADDVLSKTAGYKVLTARVAAQIRRKEIEDEHRAVRERLLRGEAEVERSRAARELAETRAAMAEQLSRANHELTIANRELEAFSYSVSHDLRAPLRSIRTFTEAIAEELGTSLPTEVDDHIKRVRNATIRMGDLIDALLELAKTSRSKLERTPVDLGDLTEQVFDELRRRDPARDVKTVVAPNVSVSADRRMLRALLDNLVGNAWKFTGKKANARIEVGVRREDAETIYFVRDNGAGFDQAHAKRLFAPFQRLHNESDFAGTGIGLATSQRIVERHGGRIWAEGGVGTGATFSFTLGERVSSPA